MASTKRTTSRKKNAGTASSRLQVEYRAVVSLKPNPRNARAHSEKQLDQIAQSIRTFGFNVPILVDENLDVIAGHGRLVACKQLDIKEVPTIKLEHLTPQQRSAFMIADNRLTENSKWDERLLGEQLQILAASDLDFSIEVTGFEMGEIDVFIEGLTLDENEKDPADSVSDAAAGPPITLPGDLWCLGRHRVLCSDSLDAASYENLMGNRKANLVFTDPPFNVIIDGHVGGLGKHHHREFAMASGEMSDAEFTAFLKKALSNAALNSLNGSIHFIFMDWRHSAHVLAAGNEVYSEFKNLCVWAKDTGGMGSLYRSQHELIFVFKHGKSAHRNNIQLGKYGRYRTNVWNYPGAHSFARGSSEGNLALMHPTVKPVALVADAIMDCSARGELVLDPFLGSGTTLIAAERTGRVCYGLELDPLYVDTIIRRWQKFTGASANLLGTEESFRSREEVLSVKR